MAGEEELVLGREAMVAPSIAERVRERAAAMLDSAAPADGRAGVADFALDDEDAARRRVAMFLAIAAPLLFVAAIITAAALVGEPQADEQAATFAEAPLAQPTRAAVRPAAASVAASSSAAIHAPSGAAISTLSLDGDRLAVHMTGKGAEEIVVYNIASGAVVARLAVERDPDAPSLQMIAPGSTVDAPLPSIKPADAAASGAER